MTVFRLIPCLPATFTRHSRLAISHRAMPAARESAGLCARLVCPLRSTTTLVLHDRERQHHLNTRLAAVLLILLGVALALIALVYPEHLGHQDNLLYYAGGISMVFSYLINRAGYVRLATWLITGTTTLVTSVAPFISDGIAPTVTLAILPVLVTAALYSPRMSVLITGMSLSIMTVLSLGYRPEPMYFYSLLFVLIIDLAILGFMFHFQRQEQTRRIELETVNQMLRDSESLLETRIAQRTGELAQAVDRAEKANQAKSVFLTTVSHELRTPLNAVLNFNQFVATGLYGPVNDRQRVALDRATDSTRRLMTLITDILDMSEIESGQFQLQPQSGVDLAPELEAVAAATRPLIAASPILFRVEIAPDLPPLRVDARRLRQAILHLTANAVRFTMQGEIRLTACYTPRGHQGTGQVQITVSDTGPGIAVEDQRWIFEPFRQAQRRGSVAGIGLGLPVARGIVEAHGGTLTLQSEPGAGAEFRIILPVSA